MADAANNGALGMIERAANAVSRDEFDRLYRQVNGNGQPGLVQRFDAHARLVEGFIVTSEQRQKEAEDRQKEKEKRIAFWTPIVKWALTGLGAALLALITWAYSAITPVVKILWEDYLRAHPIVLEKLKNKSINDYDPAYAVKKKQPELSDGR